MQNKKSSFKCSLIIGFSLAAVCVALFLFLMIRYSLKGNFNFDESNFKNIVAGNNSFEAEVISPTQFYGADVDISNLKVKVDYTDTALAKMIISYSTDNATIQTVYAFE
jgi:hypothetical protein